MGVLKITGSLLFLIGLALIFGPLVVLTIGAIASGKYENIGIILLGGGFLYFIWIVAFGIVGVIFLVAGAYLIKE
jgi:hypothetical protein